jgi:hypothetical protein
MFSDALPSLKLNTQGKLSGEQRTQLNKKRMELQESLQFSNSTMASDDLVRSKSHQLQGQGAGALQFYTNSYSYHNAPQPFENLKHPVFQKN